MALFSVRLHPQQGPQRGPVVLSRLNVVGWGPWLNASRAEGPRWGYSRQRCTSRLAWCWRPSRIPAGSPAPHPLTSAPHLFSPCCHGTCIVAPAHPRATDRALWAPLEGRMPPHPPRACCAYSAKGLVRAVGALGPPWQIVGGEGLARIQAGLGREMARQLMGPVSPGRPGDSIALCTYACDWGCSRLSVGSRDPRSL